jgi:hypothetical protein
MGVVWGSERDQQDRALLSLTVFGRKPVEHFSASDQRLGTGRLEEIRLSNSRYLGMSSLSERSGKTRRKMTTNGKISDPAADANRQKAGKER